MPAGAVYQPTTVTYEQQPSDQRWNCPISYFSRRVTSSMNSRVCGLRILICLFGAVVFLIGVSLAIAGGVEYGSAGPAPEPAMPEDTGTQMLIAGGTLMCIGLLFSGMAGWGWRSHWAGGKDTAGSGAAALTALNPSTDPLVAAQYVPVKDAPPAPDDEMRNLMDNKECLSSAEESDKMLDGRPSIA